MSETDFYKIDILNYPVYLGNHMWDILDAFLKDKVLYGEIFLLTDHNTHEHCLPLLIDNLPLLADRPVFSVLPGEGAKNVTTLIDIWHWLMDSGATKRAMLINLGGGVVSDLGGFAAATYKREIGCINLPTSLIGQVDAAIGSKTGININGVKNQAGVFKDPDAVFVIPDFLKTLPAQHYKSGKAEIIKSAALAGKELWKLAEKMVGPEMEVPSDLIRETVAFKCKVVHDDPFDHSTRHALNFGHTIGHGLESVFSLKDRADYSHGDAVASGMICEAYIAHKIAGLPEDEMEALSGMITGIFDFKPLKEDEYVTVWEMMAYDKKNTGDEVAVSLLEHLGMPILGKTVDQGLVYKSFEYFNLTVQK